MARSHASRFGEVLDRIEVTAVVDIQKERAQAVADLLGNDPVVETDYRKVMEHVDAVLVVLPHHLHHRATVDCLKAGKHVLVEKPMANSAKLLEHWLPHDLLRGTLTAEMCLTLLDTSPAVAIFTSVSGLTQKG